MRCLHSQNPVFIYGRSEDIGGPYALDFARYGCGVVGWGRIHCGDLREYDVDAGVAEGIAGGFD
jgi:hypothetical protein